MQASKQANKQASSSHGWLMFMNGNISRSINVAATLHTTAVRASFIDAFLFCAPVQVFGTRAAKWVEKLHTEAKGKIARSISIFYIFLSVRDNLLEVYYRWPPRAGHSVSSLAQWALTFVWIISVRDSLSYLMMPCVLRIFCCPFFGFILFFILRYRQSLPSHPLFRRPVHSSSVVVYYKPVGVLTLANATEYVWRDQCFVTLCIWMMYNSSILSVPWVCCFSM